MIRDDRPSQGVNWSLLGVVLAISLLGLLNLSSALYSWGQAGGMRLLGWQAIWVTLGLVSMGFLWRWDYRRLQSWGHLLYVASLVLLILVLFFGKVVAGHRSWLGWGGFGIQPSEIAKVACIIMLSKFFSDHPHPLGQTARDLLPSAGLVLLPAFLVAVEGDLGTTLFFLLLWISMAAFAGIQRRTFLAVMAAGIVLAGAAYIFVLSPYQKDRVTSFLRPSSDVRGQGYQVAQSKVAVGSGGWVGKGYREGSVNKLNYLPEKHTDFIFPVLAEEWGFVGASLVVGLYYALMVLAIRVGAMARDRFGAWLAVGVAIFVFWQVAINLGGVLGLMPMTGVTLPLMSYGGSSVLMTFVALGLLFSISRLHRVF